MPTLDSDSKIEKRHARERRALEKGDGHSLAGRPGPIRSRQGSATGGLQNFLHGAAAIISVTTKIRRQAHYAQKQKQREAKQKARDAMQQQRLLQLHQQRAAVRVTYTSAKSPGHWKAHGAYIQREAATGQAHAGFTQAGQGIDIPERLDSWQRQGDERMFRVIISPEAGSRLDMERLTRDVMAKIAIEAGTRLEWVAAVHNNTDHPHVHVAIRGVRDDGSLLTFPKELVKSGFRQFASKAATDQLGLRTDEELDTALVAEATKPRQTSLDYILAKNATQGHNHLLVNLNSDSFRKLNRYDPVKLFVVERRLSYLETLGLANRNADGTWALPSDFKMKLKTLTFAGDKQRMLSKHMEPASAVGSQIVSGNWDDITILQGRILGHDEDEATGRRYMLFESVDGTIIMLPHRKEIETLRAQKGLKRNAAVTISRTTKGYVVVKEHGNAEKLLTDPANLRQILGTHPVSESRPGWLGRLDAAASDAALPRRAVQLTKEQLTALLGFDKARGDEQMAVIERAVENGTVARIPDMNIPLQFNKQDGTYKAVVTPGQQFRLEQMLSSSRQRQQVAQRSKRDMSRDFER